MSTMTDAKIRAWQTAVGIEPAEGARAEALDRMSDLAHQLIEVIALESSGIRHGDGRWHDRRATRPWPRRPGELHRVARSRL